ncbi:MAG: hypothetical protein L6R39_000212 [Caloplaca ligustica]|nr:MAG: hypothetical protein L6R39_000212 [Caloplaca ligustica]
MARIQIPLDALTSRLNLSSRLEGVSSQSLSTRFANLRPISEFLNFSRLSKPAGFGEVQSRVNYNLGYFSSNYVAVAIMLLIYSLLTNLTLLFDIVFVAVGLFGIKKLGGRDLELGFTRATTSQLNGVVAGWSDWSEHSGACIIHGQTNRYSFFRGGGLGGRPRTPHFTPPWGRSSRSSADTRRQPPEHYFEELDSDDDDGQGVTLAGSHFSDELNYTGADLGPYRRNRRKNDDKYDSNSTEDDDALEDRSAETMQLALRNKEDLLVQQALERIRRAQILGKRNVRLTQPEIDALERKRRQDEANRTRIVPGSKQVNKRRSSSQLQLAGKDSKAGKRKSAGLSPTLERGYALEGRAATPPGKHGPGPDGRPIYAPMGYYPPTANLPSSSRGSRPGSRTGSSANLQQPTPALPSNQYWSGQPRHAPGYDHAPPSPSMRRLPDDPHWDPRPRSASANYQYPADPQYHQPYPSLPPPNSPPYSQGRRIVSGPAEVQYPSISRRAVPMSSAHAASSDPSLPRQAYGSGTRHQGEEGWASEEETDDDGEDYGVQVDVLPSEHGYEVRRGLEPRSGARPKKPPR